MNCFDLQWVNEKLGASFGEVVKLTRVGLCVWNYGKFKEEIFTKEKETF